jgi:truncated hemoglobin YjbI
MNDEPTQRDLFFSVEARDAALQQVAGNAGDFLAQALAAVAELRGEYTGEGIRFALEARGLIPHHHNAWGALVMAAVRDGLLIPTDKYVPMTARGSHARRTRVYRTVTQESPP